MLICGMGEGGSISQSNENDPDFSKLIWDQPLNFLGTSSTPYRMIKSRDLNFIEIKARVSHVHSDFIGSPSSGDQL